ncbi:MAG: methyltransferase domain-containing protein [Gammaproteobacteria bacterium]|jgi:phosphoethanolamine N-methyltransferase|nr:methyltransferase domain-containing protein [Gammaproteobacteria bacterium]
MDESGSTCQSFLDAGQYTRDSILKYELVYGTNFVSPGGVRCATRLIKKLGLPAHARVLDVGCGLGGSAFLMAQEFGLDVDAIDLSENMLALVRERLAQTELAKQVQLKNQNCLELNVQNYYDAIYSREVFLHIDDKQQLFSNLYTALKPSGKLLFTDYCCDEKPWQSDFSAYVKSRGYHLCTVSDYRKLLEAAGFGIIEAIDRTKDFIGFCKTELDTINSLDIAQSDRTSLKNDWLKKIERAQVSNQRWGMFYASK